MIGENPWQYYIEYQAVQTQKKCIGIQIPRMYMHYMQITEC